MLYNFRVFWECKFYKCKSEGGIVKNWGESCHNSRINWTFSTTDLSTILSNLYTFLTVFWKI